MDTKAMEAAGTKMKAEMELLPLRIDRAALEQETGMGRYHRKTHDWIVTPFGGEHPVTRLFPEPGANRALWRRLPGVHWAPVAGDFDESHVLAVSLHPAPKRRRPLLSASAVGKGRVLYIGTDETYRWRSATPRVWQRFWVRAVRWLAEPRSR